VAVNVEGKQGAHSLSFHAAPDIFGIIEIWREHPYLANVVAIEPCQALVLDRKSFLKMLQSNHQVAINLAQFVSELIYQAGRDREVQLFGKVEHLLANTICYFAKLYGEEHSYGILVRREINKSELATMLGVARRSVIRGLESLAEEQLIRLEGKQLVIPDPKALKKKARSATEA
jgi:CRP-like cAMP-binding protein